MLAVIGTIMIVRIRIAGTSRPAGVRAAEERDPAEVRLEPRVEVVAQEGAEDEDPPQPEHDARHRGEHLDQRADPPRTARGRELGQEQRDRDRERPRDQDGGEGRQGGPDEEVERAEVARSPGPRSRARRRRCRTPGSPARRRRRRDQPISPTTTTEPSPASAVSTWRVPCRRSGRSAGAAKRARAGAARSGRIHARGALQSRRGAGGRSPPRHHSFTSPRPDTDKRMSDTPHVPAETRSDRRRLQPQGGRAAGREARRRLRHRRPQRRLRLERRRPRRRRSTSTAT